MCSREAWRTVRDYPETCQKIVGEYGRRLAYCGAPTLANSSYCEAHHGVIHVTARQRWKEAKAAEAELEGVPEDAGDPEGGE